MILKTSVKIYLFFCKIVITDSLTVYWGVLFELLLLEGFGSRDPSSAVKLVVMKWTEHPPLLLSLRWWGPPQPCPPPNIRLPNFKAWCPLLVLLCWWCSAKTYRQQAIGRCPHLEFYHKVALLIETALSSDENLLLVVSWAAASQLFDKTHVRNFRRKKQIFVWECSAILVCLWFLLLSMTSTVWFFPMLIYFALSKVKIKVCF